MSENRIVDCAVMAAFYSSGIAFLAYILSTLIVWRVRHWNQRTFPNDQQTRELMESEQQVRAQLQQQYLDSDPILIVAQTVYLCCHFMGLVLMSLIRRLRFNSIVGTYQGWLLFLCDFVGWWMLIFVVSLLQRT